MADEQKGWTRFFRRKDLEGEDFFAKFLGGLTRIFEGGEEEDVFRQIRSELIRVFDCEEISLFTYDPTEPPTADEGDWTLKVKAGFGEGNRVSQRDALAVPELEPGRPIAHTDRRAQEATLKAIALAFERGAFYGCDIERKKIVLVEDPRPEDDLGSGDLSVLAIPLFYHHRVGRITERVRVGVLALFKTPVRRELHELETHLRSLLAFAVVTPRTTLKDPVTGLFCEGLLREELGRQLGLFELTRGKVKGGVVVGMIDTLRLYKQTLETAGNVDPTAVGQRVSDVLSGVGACLWKRCREHTLGPSAVYRSGYPGRIGTEGFGAILPVLRPSELVMWAVRLSKDVIEYRFEGEELLEAGDVTVSLRVIPFVRGSADELWALARKALGTIAERQQAARRDPAKLRGAVNQLEVFHGGRWLSSADYSRELRG